MEALRRVFVLFAWSGLLIAAVSGSGMPAAAQQAAVLERSDPAATPSVATNDGDQAKIVELPDSPGATISKAEGAAKQQDAARQPWTVATLSPQSGQSETPGTQSQPAPQKPVGTAVAEAPNASGVAASQPAGVAIAPAKQRRVRTIVLRMGAIVGAGVAVGSVIALTAATPSKPPGAH